MPVAQIFLSLVGFLLTFCTCFSTFPGVKRPGRAVDHYPHLAPRLKKEQSYISTHLWIFMACSRVNFSSNFASSSPLMPTSQIFSLFYYSFPLNTIFSSSSPCHYQHWHLFYVTLSYICFSFSYFFIALFPSLYTLSLPNSCIIVSLSILCLSVLPLSWLRVVSLFLL